MNIEIAGKYFLSLLRKARQYRTCYASGNGDCSGKIIHAHSISKMKTLGQISRNSEVITIETDAINNSLSYESIRIEKASVFFGFCEHHDSTLFAKIDNTPLSTDNQAMLQYHIRCVALELHKKQTNTRGLRSALNADANDQLDQDTLEEYLEYTGAGIKDLEHEMDQSLLLLSTNKGINSVTLDFDRFEIPMVASSPYPVDCDFFGNQIFDFDEFGKIAPIIGVNFIKADGKQRCIFTWRNEFSSMCEKWVKSFIDRHTSVGLNIFSLIIHFCENTYFSPQWFDESDKRTKRNILDAYSQYLSGNHCKVEEIRRMLVLKNIASYPKITWQFDAEHP